LHIPIKHPVRYELGVFLSIKSILNSLELKIVIVQRILTNAIVNTQINPMELYTFCNEVAKAGVYKWIIDLDEMTCA